MNRYPSMCRMHKEHSDDCMACIAFDTAVKAHLKSYTTPIHAHPTVVNVKMQEWIGTIFPVPAKP